MSDHGELEERRSEFQVSHDILQGSTSRNEEGQYATDFNLAKSIVKETIKIGDFPEHVGLKFFEPAIGSGSFFSALIDECDNQSILRATGVEINPELSLFSSQHWKESNLEIINSDIYDFVRNHDIESNLLITNPPYSRHHHIESSRKIAWQELIEEMTGIRLSGLSGLHCYIMSVAHTFLGAGGISAWLVPQEILDVGYSKNLKKILFSNHEILKIHNFGSSESKFEDASVTSIVVFMRKKSKPSQSPQKIQFSVGKIEDPAQTKNVELDFDDCDMRWSKFFSNDLNEKAENNGVPLSEFITVRRGIATGKNDFFINPSEYWTSIGILDKHLIPIIPPPRDFKRNVVNQEIVSQKAFPYLLNVDVEPEQFEDELALYLDSGIKKRVNEGYLCSKRPKWYTQETRKSPDFFLTYIGRKKSTGKNMFKFIRNNTNAICSNNYLMLYKRQDSKLSIDELDDYLNSLTDEELTRCAREYGDGMFKLEPSEVLNLRLDI